MSLIRSSSLGAVTAVKGVSLLSLLALASGLALFTGCSNSDSAGGDEVKENKTRLAALKSPSENLTGRSVLQQMVRNYQEAKTYSDQGVARMRYQLNGELVNKEFHLSVAYARPNRLWLKAYDGEVVCDGQRICALHKAVHGYVRMAEAPEKLTVARIYGDPFFWSMLNERQVGGPIQVDLLLGENFLDNLLKSTMGEAKLIDSGDAGPVKIEGEVCHRVKLTMKQGDMVFWIGQQSSLLRRVEYPTDELRSMLQQQGTVTELSVTAEFVKAKRNEPLKDNVFQFKIPSDAKEVKQFVGPSLSEILGKKISNFEFVSLADGKKIAAESLQGKVVVLDFWATWCGFCLQKMPEVAKAREKFKSNDKVQFLAVSIDQADVTDEQIKEKLANLKIDLPLARDPKLHAFSHFKILGVPSRVILGSDGSVQAVSVGLTPEGDDPVAQLAGNIESLLNGKDLYTELIAEFERAMMETPPEPIDESEASLPEAKIAPQSPPEKVKLVSKWSCAELSNPGNVLVIHSSDGESADSESTDGPGRLYVVDGLRSVAEINPVDGKLVTRHELKIPDGVAVAFLRTAVDGQGQRYFAAGAVGQSQVFVFDDQWKLQCGYPAAGNPSPLGDAQLVDLNGDGTLELAVCYLKEQGVQLATLQGQEIWADRKLEDVVSLAVSSADEQGRRNLLCIHLPGHIAVLDHLGQLEKKLSIGDQYLRWLVAARSDELGQDAYAGFAYIAPTTLGAPVTDALLGVDLSGKALWTYILPSGQQPWLEQLSIGRLVGDHRHWIVASADGSFHFVGFDGQLLDRFNVGAAIAGFAATEVDGQRVLFISSGDRLEAWQVKSKE